MIIVNSKNVLPVVLLQVLVGILLYLSYTDYLSSQQLEVVPSIVNDIRNDRIIKNPSSVDEKHVVVMTELKTLKDEISSMKAIVVMSELKSLNDEISSLKKKVEANEAEQQKQILSLKEKQKHETSSLKGKQKQITSSLKEERKQILSPLNNTNQTVSFLGCEEIAQLEIVRILGEGNQKTAYEVRLPNSEKHAVAKRCRSHGCIYDKTLLKEATTAKSLQNQYGKGQVMEFYGECYAPEPVKNKRIKKHIELDSDIPSNFTIGATIVMEIGEPLRRNWTIMDRYCLVKQFTQADREDLRQIARQWANYTHGGPMRLGKDNRHAQQYVLTDRGIRHADTDWIIPCSHKQYKREECSYEKVLDFNCKVLSIMAAKTLNCSLAYSLENPIKYPNHHINLTDVNQKCIPQY